MTFFTETVIVRVTPGMKAWLDQQKELYGLWDDVSDVTRACINHSRFCESFQKLKERGGE